MCSSGIFHLDDDTLADKMIWGSNELKITQEWNIGNICQIHKKF